MSTSKPTKKDVHTEHCCRICGCKYGKDDVCTVATGAAPASYPCEYEDDHALAETGLTPRELLAERDAFRAESELRQHQVITCGVAATHPDPTLTLSGAYAGKWNTQQADQVRSLRAERDELLAQRDELLEVSRMFVGWLDDGTPASSSGHDRFCKIAAAARAAIAKTKEPKS